MTWGLHRVLLGTHDLAVAGVFFGEILGLGAPRTIDAQTIGFGSGSRGLHVRQKEATIARQGAELMVPTSRHVAIEVPDLDKIVRRLDGSGVPHINAKGGEFDVPAIYTLDPAQNVVALCQSPITLTPSEIQPWEKDWGWGIHHVNLPAGDVRKVVAFYCDIAGLPEGRWRAPASRGDFSIDPIELSILPLGEFNRGLHVIRPDAGFAQRNNFAHNPSIGGHPALFVKDVKAIKARLEAAGAVVSDAGVYAMVGMHQIYVLDPTANMIEVNQFI